MISGPVVLLIRSLDVGGAQRQVVQLATGLHRRGVPVRVITFYEGGAMGADLDRAGVPRESLGKASRWDVVRFLCRLVVAVRRVRPAIAYGFLPTANALLAMLRPVLPRARIVWGIRASAIEWANYDLASRFSYLLERAVSWVPDLIIANSEVGRRQALTLGYPRDRIVVVPNGIDVNRFRRDDAGRRRIRAEWGVSDDELLVGLVARLDPMKDHRGFLQAARTVAIEIPSARFVCVGDGPEPLRRSLIECCKEFGLEGRVIWSGQRDDMPAVLSALDLACSSSAFGEGFSNALGEALCCSVPCVGTDVGDTALVIGDAGRVVPPRDPAALARAIVDVLRLPPSDRVKLQERARARVVENFGEEALVQRTIAAWASCTRGLHAAVRADR